MTRYVPVGFFGIAHEGVDMQRQYAARLLLSGYDAESAALMSELPLEQVKAMAANLVDEFAPPP